MEFETNTEKPIKVLFEEIKALEPKPVASFVPANAAEQKELFLGGEIENPHHEYDRLDTLDFAQTDEALARLGANIAAHKQIPEKYKATYHDFIQRYRSVNHLMQVAALLSAEDLDDELKKDLEDEYRHLNIELYGDVEHDTYSGLIASKMQRINTAQLGDGMAFRLREELTGMLPKEIIVGEDTSFRPSEETVQVMGRVVNELYGELLKHVPDVQRSYGPHEIAAIFQRIIDQEFGDAAEGWRAEVMKAKSINVVSSEKLIKVPEDRKAISGASLKGLVVHELGVHMLRAIRGGETDLLPMEVGFAEYYDSEEGLGKVMEQAAKGEFAPSGIPYYIIAGLLSEGHDFRQTYERVWRLNVLEAAADGAEVTDDFISKKQSAAYSSVMRMTRGTDRLAWLKDLAYYNGSVDMWRYFERHSGDELMLNAALIGKIDPANQMHINTAMDTNTAH